jgi:hypothetical protein
MKQFNVPNIYRSPLISAIKQQRRQQDKLKKDFTPTLLILVPADLPGQAFWFLLWRGECHRDRF